MRRITTILLVFISATSFTQSIQIELTDATVVSGGCIEVSGKSTDFEVVEELHVRNISSNTLTVKIDRIELEVNCSTQHAVCWGICPAPTVSCTEPTKSSVNAQDQVMNAGDVNTSLAGHHYPENNSDYAIYRYVAYDKNNPSDQAFVNILFKHGADNPNGGCVLALNEQDKISFVISPNPATNLLNVDIADGKNYSLQLINILGKTVMSKGLTAKNAIDVTSFDRGIYFVKITDEKGAEVKTSKIVLE